MRRYVCATRQSLVPALGLLMYALKFSCHHHLLLLLGYLSHWPLKQPNADPKIPSTIADMVCILTDAEAAGKFHLAEQSNGDNNNNNEGVPSQAFDYKTSQVMKDLLRQSHRRTGHVRAPGILGHVVNPGCLSFYTLDGRTFAVAQGRWLLSSPKAFWISKNVSIDQDKVRRKGFPLFSMVICWRLNPAMLFAHNIIYFI